MIIYFSAGWNITRIRDFCYKNEVRNYLFSFWNLQKNGLAREAFDYIVGKPDIGLMIDSGAHTFQKGEVRVDYDKFIHEYIEFINKYSKVIDCYVELDIENIVGLKQVEKWTDKLIKNIDKPPIVVWHRQRGFDYWKKMCKQYPYIGFSGFVTTPSGGPEVPDKYLPLFLKTAKETNTKIHGFGYTRLNSPYLRYFYSVDSTSWLSGGRWNRLLNTNKPIKSDIHYKKKDIHNIKYMLLKEQEINSSIREGR